MRGPLFRELKWDVGNPDPDPDPDPSGAEIRCVLSRCARMKPHFVRN